MSRVQFVVLPEQTVDMLRCDDLRPLRKFYMISKYHRRGAMLIGAGKEATANQLSSIVIHTAVMHTAHCLCITRVDIS